KAYVSLMGTTQLHLRAPWVIAWWSAAFPGFGHFLLSKYLRGAFLFIWEVIVNVQSHLNMAIFYSFNGHIDMAKQVLDTRWLLLYAPVFVFGIWDSYRTANDMNNIFILAYQEDAYFKPFRIGAFEINYLDKRKPWNAIMWSLLMPGLGQLYIHRILVTFFILIWWIAICYYSHLLQAIQYAFIGEGSKAVSIIDKQWVLFMPSLYGFSIYDAYVNTVENNKLYNQEQRRYLKTNYQKKLIEISDMKMRSGTMHVISCFKQSIELEQAISALENLGITSSKLLAAPLNKREKSRKLFDSMHYTDGSSLFDLGAVLGTIFMLFGVIFGFKWKIGPIFAGLAGLGVGFAVGLLIDYFVTKRKIGKEELRRTDIEVVLIVECTVDQLEQVEKILWQHFALGISKVG
ncbi:MAG: hypothetical protein ACXVO1_09720, partial [Tumebacillaceae bacterium]